MEQNDQISRLLAGILEEVDDLASDNIGTSVKHSSPRRHLSNISKLTVPDDPLASYPIRTIHHLSCTGGTLFSKCIASMRNTLVLNEINLFSRMGNAQEPAQFTPTDMIGLLRQSGEPIPTETIESIFLKDLTVVREEQWASAHDLVLREHSHSKYLFGDDIQQEPNLLQVIQDHFPLRSLITVRHPVDSWISMGKQGWRGTFSPSTFDEYCRRYLVFLEDFRRLPIVKYEDFVKDPKRVMREICEILELRFFEDFQKVFSRFQFSGDSGRGGSAIEPKKRSVELVSSLGSDLNSEHYLLLLERLSYSKTI